MGLRPTHRDESHRFHHPRAKPALSLPKGGGPCPDELDSRLHGNDVTFESVAKGCLSRRRGRRDRDRPGQAARATR
jgi:hypothetical protein